MDWAWLPQYVPVLVHGLLITLLVLTVSVTAGFVLAVPIGLVQARRNGLAARLARVYCDLIRGTPLLMQLYLLYYGLGSLFPLLPGMHGNFEWLVRLDAIYYVLVAFTLSFAGYAAEIMRGAFLNVPRGALEAGAALGMSDFLIFRRIWFPSAFSRVFPTLAGEVVSQLKATPLAFTLPVADLMAAAHRVMQDTLHIYEPLLLVALVYLVLTFGIVKAFSHAEHLFRPDLKMQRRDMVSPAGFEPTTL